jgi:hypothetical protein
MSESANAHQHGGSQTGFIGFFDLLGYKEFIRNNQLKEVAQKVRDILRVCRTSKILNEGIEHLFGNHFCEHVIFSDTILIYSNTTSDPSATLFTSFCTSLVNGLFRAGYPVRGALASGEFYVEVKQASICLAGAPIVEAYELADCLDFAGCVVAPSAERFLALKSLYFQYEVPIKGCGKQRMFILNAISDEEESRGISRQIVLDMFGAHNKRIGVDVLPKINNTIAFLEACKREACRTP